MFNNNALKLIFKFVRSNNRNYPALKNSMKNEPEITLTLENLVILRSQKKQKQMSVSQIIPSKARAKEQLCLSV